MKARPNSSSVGHRRESPLPATSSARSAPLLTAFDARSYVTSVMNIGCSPCWSVRKSLGAQGKTQGPQVSHHVPPRWLQSSRLTKETAVDTPLPCPGPTTSGKTRRPDQNRPVLANGEKRRHIGAFRPGHLLRPSTPNAPTICETPETSARCVPLPRFGPERGGRGTNPAVDASAVLDAPPPSTMGRHRWNFRTGLRVLPPIVAVERVGVDRRRRSGTHEHEIAHQI